MSYEMKSLRKEDLSLYFYLKDIVLRDFMEREEYVSLRMMSEYCTPGSYVYEAEEDCRSDELEPCPTERGRGWVYFDDPVGGNSCTPYATVSGWNGDGEIAYGTPEQSNSVILYETTSSGLEAVDWLDYMIDYIDGRIISTRELNEPYITYKWNYVSVVDEWSAIEAANPPVVVIDMHGTNKAGYQLGGGKKATRKVNIHVFASNTAERNDIVESIYDGLYNRSCTFYDFPTGSVLEYDGTFYGRKDLEDRMSGSLINTYNKLTYLFDRSQVSNVSKLEFDSVEARHVNLPLVMTRGRDEIMLSDLNAYRSKVSFDMRSYDDRIIT